MLSRCRYHHNKIKATFSATTAGMDPGNWPPLIRNNNFEKEPTPNSKSLQLGSVSQSNGKAWGM
jgi:hypothetical protein